MRRPYFVHGELYAPFYVFVKARLADADLLSRFGLGGYDHATIDDRFVRYALLANDGEWTMLADDWCYTLWHMPTARPTIAELGRTFDVFACSVGDIDRSYDLAYYRDGELVRKYAVSDLRGIVVEHDVGEPLSAEAHQHPDEMNRVLGIAASVGIRTRYEEHEIRAYNPGGER